MNLFFVPGRSFYPLWTSTSVGATLTSLILFFKYGDYWLLLLSVVCLVGVVSIWGYTLILESSAGCQSEVILNAMKLAFMLFILSEAMFFFAIFWTFFDAALSPPVDLGMEWSPLGIMPVSPSGIPLLNTVTLLSSSVTLTWSHNCLLSKDNPIPGLWATLVLAVCFMVCQYIEYRESTFSMSDGIYGSVFYFSTGTHGVHVFLGTIFLGFNLGRMYCLHFSSGSHMTYEMAILYWHFVDVVWLFLFFAVYYWGY